MATASGVVGVVRDGVAERKRSVMAAAEELVAQEGYDVVRLRDIARRAGVSVGLIQHYFDSREALLLETMSEASMRRAQEWAQLGAGFSDPTARVRALLRGSVGDRQRCIMWMTMCSASTRHPEVLSHVAIVYDAWRASLGEALQDGIDAGAFAPVRPLQQVLDTILAMIDGLITSAGLSLQEFDREQSANLLEDVVGHLLQVDFRRGAVSQLSAG